MAKKTKKAAARKASTVGQRQNRGKPELTKCGECEHARGGDGEGRVYCAVRGGYREPDYLFACSAYAPK